MHGKKYGGKVFLLEKTIDADGLDKAMRKAIDDYVDENNEVRIVLCGDTYNIIQDPIIRPKSEGTPTVRAAIYDPHKGLYKKKPSSKPPEIYDRPKI